MAPQPAISSADYYLLDEHLPSPYALKPAIAPAESNPRRIILGKRAQQAVEALVTTGLILEGSGLADKRTKLSPEKLRSNLLKALQKNILEEYKQPDMRTSWAREPEFDQELFSNMAEIASKYPDSELFIRKLKIYLVGQEMELTGDETGGDNMAKVQQNLKDELSSEKLEGWINSVFKIIEYSKNLTQSIEAQHQETQHHEIQRDKNQNSWILSQSASKSRESLSISVERGTGEQIADSIGDCSRVNNVPAQPQFMTETPSKDPVTASAEHAVHHAHTQQQHYEQNFSASWCAPVALAAQSPVPQVEIGLSQRAAEKYNTLTTRPPPEWSSYTHDQNHHHYQA